MPEDPRPDQVRPVPLNYRPPEPGTRPEYVVFAVMGGFILGCAALCFPGAIIFIGTHPLSSGGHVSSGAVGVVLYTFLFVSAIAGAIRTIKRWRDRKQYFLSGFLLGIGVTALLEGICFGVG